MMLTSKELKRNAREALAGRYGLAMLSFVIIQLLTLAAGSPFQPSPDIRPSGFSIAISLLASLILALLSSVLDCGLISIHLNLARGKKAAVASLFQFFKTRPDRAILSRLLLEGMAALIMLPAIVLTLIAVFAPASFLLRFLAAAVWILTLVPFCAVLLSYDLVFYLLIERPADGILSVFAESRRLMKGKRVKKLYLNLSFLGLLLLSILSFGIGLLWVAPYFSQVQAQFYRNVVGEI